MDRRFILSIRREVRCGDGDAGGDLGEEGLRCRAAAVGIVVDETGVLIHEEIAAPGPVDATLTVTRADFLASIFGGQPLPPKVASGAAKVEGDASALLKLAQWMDPPNPAFPIVTR